MYQLTANIQTNAMFCSFCEGGRGWPENQEIEEQNLGSSWREQHCGEDAGFRPPGPLPKRSLETIHHCFPWHFQAQVHVYTLRNHDNKYMALEFEQVFPLSNGGTLVNQLINTTSYLLISMWFWKPKQDPYLELAALEKLGVDGVFTDNTPTGSKMKYFLMPKSL